MATTGHGSQIEYGIKCIASRYDSGGQARSLGLLEAPANGQTAPYCTAAPTLYQGIGRLDIIVSQTGLFRPGTNQRISIHLLLPGLRCEESARHDFPHRLTTLVHSVAFLIPSRQWEIF